MTPQVNPLAAPSTPEASWLEAHWMPFTANRQFKSAPRLFARAEGAYYTDMEGRRIFDGLSGLWCTGLGHARREIVEAVSRQVATLDYAPAFQFGHPLSFELANRIVERMPAGLDHVMFSGGSGSDAVDTSLKIARAYWQVRGQGAKTRLIGRGQGYHGVNFGGISVGGLVANRRLYGPGIETAHLADIQPPAGSFHRGEPPADGAHLADSLLSLIKLYDASTIAAVIVEPFSGSAGVIVPPKGYLQRLREICSAHDILLIFDEVITGFGRCGAWTGAQAFGITHDLLDFANQSTNGLHPLSGVVVKKEIYDTLMAAGGKEYLLELPHGYTYSAHPVACAAGVATLELLAREQMPERVRELTPRFERAVHALRAARHVADIRNYGLAAGLTLEAIPGEPARRPFEVAMAMLKKGFYVRYGGATLQLAPPFISTETEIDRLVEALGETLNQTD